MCLASLYLTAWAKLLQGRHRQYLGVRCIGQWENLHILAQVADADATHTDPQLAKIEGLLCLGSRLEAVLS